MPPRLVPNRPSPLLLHACSLACFWRLASLLVASALSLLPSGHAAADESVRFHIVDRGIEQPWNKDVPVGQATESTLTMFPSLNDPSSRLVLQMPTDKELITSSEMELANLLAEALMRQVRGAQLRGISEFEITIIQHIGRAGYGDMILNLPPRHDRQWLQTWQTIARFLGLPTPRNVAIETTGNRQELVKKFGRSYLMAIDRVLQSQVSAGKHPEVDFWVGSNGTFALTEAHEVIKNFRDKVTHVTLIDGRAFVESTAKFIRALGERGDEKVTITNTFGDMPGHKWNIALHSAALGLQKQFKGLTVLLLEPLDADKRDIFKVANEYAAGSDNPDAFPRGAVTYDEYDNGVKPLSSHVLWMVRPTARFRVIALNGDTKHQLGDLSSVDLVRGITSGKFAQSSGGRSGQQNADRRRNPTDKPPSATRRQDWPPSPPMPPFKGPDSPPPPPPGTSVAVASPPTPYSATRSEALSSTRGIGGVKLAIEELAGDAMPSITALVYDEKTKRLVLMGEHSLNVPRIEEADLAMALWLVFGPNAGDPQFSLDAADPRDPSGKWLKAVYMPNDLKGHPFGETMFIADFAMKQLALAARVTASGTIEARPPPVPGFKSVADFIWDRPDHASGNHLWARFWIVVDEIVVRRVANALYFEKVKIGVRAKRQVVDPTSRTGLRDVDTPSDSPESQWAAQLTARFNEVAEAMPQEFGRLKELAKAMAICKFLKQQGIAVDLSWAAAKLNAHAVPATDKITALSMEWKREQDRPFSDGRRRGIEKTTRTMRLFGGADLTVNPKYVPDDGRAASASQALSVELSRNRAAPVFSVRVGEQKFYAKVLPITESGQLVWREHSRALASATR